MSFKHNLQYGDELDSLQLRTIFKHSPYMGMRKSNLTNTLVLVSDHTQPYYNDRWEGDIFYYTGMGLKGDQKIDFFQNKTLAESNSNGVEVFLFEVNNPKIYTFVGKVKLADKPFKEHQVDKNNNTRIVWIFPLKLDNKIIKFDEFVKKQEVEAKKINQLPIKDIRKKALNASKVPKQRDVIVTVFERDASVSEFIKISAKGICQLCNKKAPFKTRDNKPYLEVHHIDWLSENGDDSIYNVVALCPNCHRKMHILNLDSDKCYLKRKINN